MQVEELLDRENLRFKSAGKDVLIRCLNPEHQDTHPSLRIDRITGVFNCFGCGFSGNIFTHYNESVDTLGIKVLQLKKKISGIVNNEMLLPLGREPFKRDHRGISGETYEYFEAFIHDNYDGRIVFPIRDITGRLLSLMGRYAFSDASPKYLVDPPHAELPIFPPKPEVYKDSIIIVEGLFDMLNLWDKGIKNVVCGFGKGLGDAKKRKSRSRNIQKFLPIKIQGVKQIFILYDYGAEKSEENLADLLQDLFIATPLAYPEFSTNKDAGNLNQEEVDKLKEYIYESKNI